MSLGAMAAARTLGGQGYKRFPCRRRTRGPAPRKRLQSRRNRSWRPSVHCGTDIPASWWASPRAPCPGCVGARHRRQARHRSKMVGGTSGPIAAEPRPSHAVGRPSRPLPAPDGAHLQRQPDCAWRRCACGWRLCDLVARGRPAGPRRRWREALAGMAGDFRTGASCPGSIAAIPARARSPRSPTHPASRPRNHRQGRARGRRRAKPHPVLGHLAARATW